MISTYCKYPLKIIGKKVALVPFFPVKLSLRWPTFLTASIIISAMQHNLKIFIPFTVEAISTIQLNNIH